MHSTGARTGGGGAFHEPSCLGGRLPTSVWVKRSSPSYYVRDGQDSKPLGGPWTSISGRSMAVPRREASPPSHHTPPAMSHARRIEAGGRKGRSGSPPPGTHNTRAEPGGGHLGSWLDCFYDAGTLPQKQAPMAIAIRKRCRAPIMGVSHHLSFSFSCTGLNTRIISQVVMTLPLSLKKRKKKKVSKPVSPWARPIGQAPSLITRAKRTYSATFQDTGERKQAHTTHPDLRSDLASDQA
ncbi:hypothetical protein LX36DRAFT_256059 [Colletotrichum falcatum]|nr:hypothetical protein LX36DRAFT_256059 [Colletotrichum falcatum]